MHIHTYGIEQPSQTVTWANLTSVSKTDVLICVLLSIPAKTQLGFPQNWVFFENRKDCLWNRLETKKNTFLKRAKGMFSILENNLQSTDSGCSYCHWQLLEVSYWNRVFPVSAVNVVARWCTRRWCHRWSKIKPDNKQYKKGYSPLLLCLLEL